MERSLVASFDRPQPPSRESPSVSAFCGSRELWSHRPEVARRGFTSPQVHGTVLTDGAAQNSSAPHVVDDSAVSRSAWLLTSRLCTGTGRAARNLSHVGFGTAPGPHRDSHAGQRARPTPRPARPAPARHPRRADPCPRADVARRSQGGASDSGGVAPTGVRVTHILRSRRRERG